MKERICHDCLQSLKEGEEVVKYELANGQVFYKCSSCYQQQKELTGYQPCEVYSRIVGYIRPLAQWNIGKAEEYKDRQEFLVEKNRCC